MSQTIWDYSAAAGVRTGNPLGVNERLDLNVRIWPGADGPLPAAEAEKRTLSYFNNTTRLPLYPNER